MYDRVIVRERMCGCASINMYSGMGRIIDMRPLFLGSFPQELHLHNRRIFFLGRPGLDGCWPIIFI